MITAAGLAAVVVVAYTLADRTQVDPAGMTAAVVAALNPDSSLDPAGRSSKRSWDGFSIRGCKCSNRDCLVSGNSLLLEPAPSVDY